MTIADKNYVIEAGNAKVFGGYENNPCDKQCRHLAGTYDCGGVTPQGQAWHFEVCGTCGAGRSEPGQPWKPAH